MDGGIRVNEWLRSEGLLDDAARARAAHVARRRRHRLVAARPRGARAATTRASSSTSADREPEGTIAPEDYERVRDDLARRLAGDPGREREPDPDDASTSPRRSTPRSTGVAPGPDRPLRRPALALGRHGRRRRGHPHVRERHGPGRREPRAARDLRARRARASSPSGATACTCSTSRRPCSSCSASTLRRRCAATACSTPVAVPLSGLESPRGYLTPVTVTARLAASTQPGRRPSGRTAMRRRRRALHGLPLERHPAVLRGPLAQSGEPAVVTRRRGAAGRASSPRAPASPAR